MDIRSQEDQLRDQLRAERDREIEMIIARLEEEMAAQHKLLQQQVETRLERQRDKYDAQLRDMDALHRTALDKVECFCSGPFSF